jgi:histidyl-tRNA synthetase
MSKKTNFQSPKGMHDILPQEQQWWDKIRKEIQEIADFYNFLRIDTPIVEKADLFEKSLGATTDVVEKQMFFLKDKGGDNLVLRPEGTASIARAYLQHGLSHLGQPLKLYYVGPMFRYERPQAGRYRQFHQAGLEIIGSDSDPIYEVQVIMPLLRLLESLKLKGLVLKINSIGCKNCRPEYVQKLRSYYRSRQKDICKDCSRRLKFNPLRLLDCVNPDCQSIKQEAPIIVDSLCTVCSRHFKEVLEYLDELNLPYQLDHYLVRGLDYYNRTVFEIFSEVKIADGQSFNFALASGGRYDQLFEVLGSRSVFGVGAAMGMERVVEAMKALNVSLGIRGKSKVFLIHIGNQAKKKSLSLIEEFWKANVPVEESLGKDSLNAQMRAADKRGAVLALIFGQKEVFEESIIIRDLKTGAQETVPLKKIVNEIKKRL